MNETALPTPYINAFLTERPKDSIDLMQTRLRSALKLNDELAEYFKERAMVEDLYAKNLAKLNKKPFITDKAALGTMLPTWEKIQNELLDTSNIHATFATKMIDDIEKSLRSAIVNDQAYAEVRSMDPTFQKLAKDYDDRQAKMTKHKKTLDKPGKKPSDTEAKYAEIKKQFESTRSEWKQYSSKYIQLFQNVDEHHWYDIKNYLLQFETLQTDQMLKRVQLAGDNLASVTDFSVENEILTFCGQYSNNNELSENPITTAHPPVTTTSQPPPTSPVNGSSLSEPVSPAHSSFAAPSLLIDTSDYPVEPQSTKSTDSYTSNRTTATISHHLPPVAENVYHSQPDLNIQHRQNTPSIKSKKSDKQRKFLSSFSLRLKPKSSSNSQFGHQLPDLPESTTDEQLSPVKSSSFTDNVSMYSSHDDHPSSVTTNETNHNHHQIPSSPNTLSPPTLRKATSFADSFFGGANTHSSPSHQQNATSNILVDEEGFSIPPPDRSPWATAAATGSPTSPTSSDIDQQQQDSTSDVISLDNSSLYGAPRIKLDIKNNDAAIQEDATTSQVALTRVASMLKETNPVAMKRPRGRRELRSQLFQSNTLSVYQTSSSPLAMSTILDNTKPSENNHHDETSDPTLLQSPFAHDDDHDAGEPTTTTDELNNNISVEPKLNVRITEVIHAQLQQGQLQRMVVTGEVALLYDGTPEPIDFIIQHNGTETTQLENGLLRLDDDDGDSGVQYQYTPTNDNKDYVTCLHYRQQLSPDVVMPPIVVKPMWKCDTDQARLIIKYSISNSPVVLDQVKMMTQVGGDCQGAQSMPTGQWLVDQQRMVWSLDQVTPEEQVIRAKFATTSQSNAQQPIAVRFEMKNQLVSNIRIISGSRRQGRSATISHVEQHARSGVYMAEV